MSRFLSNDYRDLVPYIPGEQLNDKRYIKLNTNESPYPPSPQVKKVLDGDIIDSLNLYPDPNLKKLTSAIATEFGITLDRVFVGNGSDDVLAFAIMAFVGRGGIMYCPDITYGFYSVYSELFGVKLKEIPLRDNLAIDVNDYIGLNGNIVIANPNAPTGLSLSVDEVERIVVSNPNSIVIIDEAYMDFCKCSCAVLLNKYDNLIVTQTFSKSRSLAGLRVGFALASSEIIKDFNKIKFSFNPYNLNTLSVTAAIAAMADKAYYQGNVDNIISVREETKADLKKMDFCCLDSKANFVFAKHENILAKVLYEKLREKGILVRYFEKPRINEYLRITIGTKKQMDIVMLAIKQIIEECRL